MGLFDGLKRELSEFSRPSREDDEPVTVDVEDDEAEAQQAPVSLDEERSWHAEDSAQDDLLSFPETDASSAQAGNSRVVPMGAAAQPKLALIQPKQFGDATVIVEHLRNKHTVVLNLEKTDPKTAGRLLDVVSGAAFALEGKMRRVSQKTFIIAPYQVDLLTITSEDLKNATDINLNFRP